MTADEAAWVRAVAWRNHHRRTYVETTAVYDRCACEYGECGYCGTGRHQMCTHETHPPVEGAATYITRRNGEVVAEVEEIGHRHVWICACKSAGHDGKPAQLSLF